MWIKRLHIVAILIGVFICTVAAQEVQQTGAMVSLTGVVRTAEGIPVPGATLRVVQPSTGKAWLSWTDENGKFQFPAIPEDRLRVEFSELGFAPATKDVDTSEGSPVPLDWKVTTATLAAINQPAETPAQAATAPPSPANQTITSGATTSGATTSGATTSGATTSGAATAGAPQAAAPPATPANPSGSTAAPGTSAVNNQSGGGGRGGRGGAGGGRFGANRAGGAGAGGQGAGSGAAQNSFSQVGLNAQGAQNPAEASAGEQPGAESQLGDAASSDAVQMIGTVAMGVAPDQFGGGFGQFGPGGPGGPDTQFGSGGAETIPGQTPAGGVGAPGAGGPGPGGPGAGFVGGGPGGGGGRGGRGGGGGGGPRGGGRGPGGRGPQSVASLYGVQRLLRQRINTIHYSIVDSYSNTALNARPYSLDAITPAKIPGWNETAGMNIGGPLKIPHIYDGSDKTFFYVNFGGGWSRTPVDSFATVPTAAERLGDFSADNVLLYNPASNLTGPRTLMPNAGCSQDAANAPGTCIPQGMINPVSQALLQYIPLPNLPGQTLNYHLQTNLPGLNNRLNVNVTHQISSKFSAQVNYNLSDSTVHALNSFPGLETNSFTRGQAVTLGLTQNYSKTFMNTTQLYFSRQRLLGSNVFSDTSDVASQLGIAGVSSNPFDYGLPQINLTNFTGLGIASPSLNRSQTYRLVDTARWLKTKHTITVGAEFRKMDIDRDTDPTPNGLFSFTGLLTSQLTSTGTPVQSAANCGLNNPAVPCIGNDFADFLLGYPANTRVQFGDTSTYFHNFGYVAYATDDFHVAPKLTVTYGVRYEAFTPPVEIDNRIVNLSVSPGFDQVQCVTPLATVGNCVSSPDRSLFHGSYNNWAPRLGIAWQPPGSAFSGKHQMTFRAGFSMFYVESYLNTLAGEMANQPPFAVANTAVTLAGTTPSSSLLTLQNGLVPATGGTVTNTVAVDPNYHVPYAMIWNTSVEYNLFSNTFLEVMYSGTRGVHLDQLFGYSLVSSGVANNTHNASGFTYDTSGGVSNLNLLQVRLQKRLSHGITFNARYTFEKSLDDASNIGGGGQTVIQNNEDPRGDYGLSSFNMRHQFLGNFTYQLPFGDRQRFFRGGWKESAFGNWRLNSSFTAHTGTPFTVRVFSTNPSCQNVPGVNSERADQVGGYAISNPTVQEWFNTAAFATPSSCFGDAARNSIIGPGAFTINSGLSKTIQFGRDGLRRLDFSWNVSNLLNNVNYTGLSTVLGSSTFGQITSAGAMRSMNFTTRVNF